MCGSIARGRLGRGGRHRLPLPASRQRASAQRRRGREQERSTSAHQVHFAAASRLLQAGSSSAREEAGVDEQRLDGVGRDDLDAHRGDRDVLAAERDRRSARRRSRRRAAAFATSAAVVASGWMSLRTSIVCLPWHTKLTFAASASAPAMNTCVEAGGGDRLDRAARHARVVREDRVDLAAGAGERILDGARAPARATTRCGSASSRSRCRRARRTARACPCSRA